MRHNLKACSDAKRARVFPAVEAAEIGKKSISDHDAIRADQRSA